jgi:hypothetical protein
MTHQPLLPWECRLCPVRHTNREFMRQHLRKAHGRDLNGDLRMKHHASVDHPNWSQNTFGYYDGEELIAIQVRIEERAADDPMRFGG